MATNYRQTTYEPRLKSGQEYQDFVARQLLREGILLVNFQSQRAQREWGENALGMEIKFDRKLESTGNVYIEIAEKSDPARPSYVPSGIYREDNAWLYAVGNWVGLFVFSKKYLRFLHQQLIYRETENETRTSQGFLIPRTEATKVAERMFGPWFEEGWNSVSHDTNR